MFEEVRERFARGEMDSDQTQRYGHPSIFGNCQGFLLLAKTVVRLLCLSVTVRGFIVIKLKVSFFSLNRAPY